MGPLWGARAPRNPLPHEHCTPQEIPLGFSTGYGESHLEPTSVWSKPRAGTTLYHRAADGTPSSTAGSPCPGPAAQPAPSHLPASAVDWEKQCLLAAAAAHQERSRLKACVYTHSTPRANTPRRLPLQQAPLHQLHHRKNTFNYKIGCGAEACSGMSYSGFTQEVPTHSGKMQCRALPPTDSAAPGYLKLSLAPSR